MEGSSFGRMIAVPAAVVAIGLLSACSDGESGERSTTRPPIAGGGGVGGGNAGAHDTDGSAPRIMATDPPADAVGVPTDGTVRVTFNEPMDATTLHTRSFTISDEGGVAVRGDVSYAGRVATFIPTFELAPAAKLTAMLTTEITDLAGHSLPASFAWSFTTAVDAWQPTPVTPTTPVERAEHTAVWTGSEMIVWGGTTAIGPAASGGRLGLRTLSWSSTSTTDAPLPRFDHTAVWSGDQMIVWGGETSTTMTRAGARYRPGVDGGSWAPTTTTGAPVPRRDHTAVWTGSEMIVWGGRDALQLLRSGGRYNPVTDTWVPVSMANAPGARIGHTAVWTGSEMIVWGGRDASQQPLRSGARYNPATDAWSALSTVDAPIGRTDHTAVWTGSEMIVWGGRTAVGFSNTGGRYDPSVDAWLPLSADNAPLARADHAAVWTGTEMILWGGRDPGVLNSGGRYQPTADRWRAVSQENAPTSRYDHTAVWTGTEMIVWGGTPGFLVNTPGTGGRYRP